MNKPKWKKINTWESVVYAKMQRIRLKRKQQLHWIQILVTHFKTTDLNLKLNDDVDCYGYYDEPEYRKLGVIHLDSNSSLGTLCHEFAHHLCWTRYCECKHNHLFILCLNDVYRVVNIELNNKKNKEGDWL